MNSNLSTIKSLLPFRVILPVLWLNSLFGSQTWYPEVVAFGQVLYWISLILASLIVVRTCGSRVWPYLLLGIIVASRLMASTDLPLARLINSGSVFVLFAAAGIILAMDAPHILERQARVFFFLSAPLILLQLMGVSESLHVFNTLYAVPGLNDDFVRPDIKMLPMLFTSIEDLRSTMISDFEQFFNWQIRPPGLAHSNAMLGIFIISGAAILFGRLSGKAMSRYDLAFISAVILCGSKLALFGFLMIAIWAYVRHDKAERVRIRRMVLTLATLFGAYAILFPGALANNFGGSAYEVSFLLRGVDALIYLAPAVALQMPGILDLIGTYPGMFSRENSELGGQISGIATLAFVLPMVLAAAVLGMKWIVSGVRYCRSISMQRARTSEFMAFAVVLAPLATPIFASQFYAFCVGTAFLPIALGFSKRMRRRLEHRVSLTSRPEASMGGKRKWRNAISPGLPAMRKES